MRWFRSLSTGDKIQAVAVAVAILALISGALVTIFVPEIRCSVHLDKCPKQLPPSGASSSASPPQFVDAPPDASKPYIVAKPKPHGLAGRALFAELNFVEMTNRGRPVVVPLSGSAATANGSVRVEMLDPGGSTFYSTSLDTDDRGLFATKLLWVPLQYLGVQGNDGAWKIRLEDMLTGEQTAVQLTVSSDDQTPEPAQWRQGDDLGLVPSKPATVEAATSGTLCSAAAMYSRVALSGFTPKVGITISFLRPDGQRVGSSGVFADGAGEVAPRFTYWQIASDLCKSPINFQYQVVAVEDGTNRRADAKILLPTR